MAEAGEMDGQQGGKKVWEMYLRLQRERLNISLDQLTPCLRLLEWLP